MNYLGWVLLLLLILGGFSKATRKQMFKRDNATCVACGRSWNDNYMIEFHHKVALFEGGSSHPSNGEARCRPCHFNIHKELASIRRGQGDKKGAQGHEDAARQIAYRIRTKGIMRYEQ